MAKNRSRVRKRDDAKTLAEAEAGTAWRLSVLRSAKNRSRVRKRGDTKTLAEVEAGIAR